MFSSDQILQTYAYLNEIDWLKEPDENDQNEKKDTEEIPDEQGWEYYPDSEI
jgi:hypothetical protein